MLLFSWLGVFVKLLCQLVIRLHYLKHLKDRFRLLDLLIFRQLPVLLLIFIQIGKNTLQPTVIMGFRKKDCHVLSIHAILSVTVNRLDLTPK